MKWTKEDVKYLKKNYPYGKKKELMKRLKRNFHTITCKAHRLRIERKVTPNLNEKNGQWKGNKATLNSIHYWVKARKPKPIWCEKCGIRKAYDLANLSQKYKRDINDYAYWCRKCHMNSKEDNRLKTLRLNHIRKEKNGKFKCSKCKKWKKKNEFGIDNSTINKIHSHCKECKRRIYNERKMSTN